MKALPNAVWERGWRIQSLAVQPKTLLGRGFLGRGRLWEDNAELLAQRLCLREAQRASLKVLFADPLVDLTAVDSDRRRGRDAESHLRAPYLQDADDDRIPDSDRLAYPPGQDQHRGPFVCLNAPANLPRQ